MKRSKAIKKSVGLYKWPIIAGVIITVLSFTVLIPTVTSLPTRFQALQERKTELETLTRKRTILESVNTSLLTYLQDAEIALPQEKDAAAILIAIENLSATTQLGIDNIDLAPGVVSTGSASQADDKEKTTTLDKEIRKGAAALPISVSARGTSQQVMDFMDQLLKTRRVMDIEKVSISYLSEQDDFVTSEFRLIAYYLPAVTQIGSIGSALPEITPEEQTVLSSLSGMPFISNSLIENLEGVETGKEDLFETQ